MNESVIRVRWQKRMLDIVVSTLACLFASPLVALGLAIYLFEMLISPASRGSIIYVDTRVSQGHEFRLLKFRIFKRRNLHQFMKLNGYVDTKTLEKDKRNLTFFGRFIKQIYLDEFPQFINVLKGDMSVVGPRPTNVANYKKGLLKGNRAKTLLRAGITGYFQSHKAVKLQKNQEEIDLEYASFCRRNSGWRIVLYDLKIMLVTLKTILQAKGV